MFELKYKITPADMLQVNKRVMWAYLIPYIVISLAGLAAGIVAITLNARTEIFVLGIILVVLAALLAACSVMLIVAPKCFVMCALIADDELERTVRIDDRAITVQTPEQTDIVFNYADIEKVKKCGELLLVYTGRDTVLPVKNAVLSGGSFEELCAFLRARVGHLAPSAAAQPGEQAQEQSENSPAEPQSDDDAAQQSEPADENVDTEAEQTEAENVEAGDGAGETNA